MEWPQVVMIILITIKSAINAAKATGWRPKSNGDGAYAIGVFTFPLLWGGVLYAGGFFS